MTATNMHNLFESSVLKMNSVVCMRILVTSRILTSVTQNKIKMQKHYTICAMLKMGI